MGYAPDLHLHTKCAHPREKCAHPVYKMRTFLQVSYARQAYPPQRLGASSRAASTVLAQSVESTSVPKVLNGISEITVLSAKYVLVQPVARAYHERIVLSAVARGDKTWNDGGKR